MGVSTRERAHVITLACTRSHTLTCAHAPTHTLTCMLCLLYVQDSLKAPGPQFPPCRKRLAMVSPGAVLNTRCRGRLADGGGGVLSSEMRRGARREGAERPGQGVCPALTFDSANLQTSKS